VVSFAAFPSVLPHDRELEIGERAPTKTSEGR